MLPGWWRYRRPIVSSLAKKHTIFGPGLVYVCDALLRRLAPHLPQRVALPLIRRPRRLLVVKVNGMGDGVLVGSIIEHLMCRNPTMEVAVLAGAGTTAEAIKRPGIVRFHCYDTGAVGLRGIIRELRSIRAHGYDAVLDFEQASVAGALFLWATGIPVRIGFVPLSDNPRALFLTHALTFRESDSMWQSFLRLAQLVDPGLPESVSVLPLPCSRQAEQRMDEWWLANIQSRPAIVFHMGSTPFHPFKRWPPTRFVELAFRFRARYPGVVIVLTGQKFERTLIREFMASYEGPMVDASHLESLDVVARLLERCDLLISNDTGTMHLGAAMGAPTIGLFGPTSPAQFAPIGRRAAAVYRTIVPCSPCISNYFERSPRLCTSQITSKCILDITPDHVIQAVEGLLRCEAPAFRHPSLSAREAKGAGQKG
jgi:ADP-heptose:LPS heptosyltransferase